MKCALCGNEKDIVRIHRGCRDDAAKNVMKCPVCGLVFLDDQALRTEELYENSGMHEQDYDFAKWLSETREDDSRRAGYIRECPYLAEKEEIDILDFGCGNGGFLRILQKEDRFRCHGVELEVAACRSIRDAGIVCHQDITAHEGKKFDVITMFHVVEHILKPLPLLRELSAYLKEDGILILETPNADDALLTRFGCEPFADFTYWSLHVFLYTTSTLERLVRTCGYRVLESAQLQRYPITNHIYWLSKGRPGGHEILRDYFDERMNALYSDALRERGICDTLWMVCGQISDRED